MSLHASRWAWSQTTLPPFQRLVLLALADHLNARTGQCNPSIGSLGKLLNMAERTVRENIRGLAQAGMIDVVSKFRADGSQTSSEYRLQCPPDPATASPPPGAKRKGGEARNGRGEGGQRTPPPLPLAPPLNQESNLESREPNGSLDGAGAAGVRAKRRVRDSELAEAVAIFHAECCPPLPAVEVLTSKRKASLGARLDELKWDMTAWRGFMRRVRKSSFLMGTKEGATWRATFDFLLKPDTIVRAREGVYDDRERPPPSGDNAASYGDNSKLGWMQRKGAFEGLMEK